MKGDVYQVITDRIIRLLESGTVPWHRPWRIRSQWPQNLVSRRVYRGINLFLLNATEYSSPFWLSFKQVQILGGRIRKGEQSFPVVFWKILEEKVDNGEEKRISFLRYHSVFNVSQCDGIRIPSVPADGSEPFVPIEKCEEVVKAMPKLPIIRHGADHAAYSPPLDEITVPEATSFESKEAYYTTLFHELVHATGHASRLSRKEICESVGFGSDPYSREELVAEMGATFLCGHCQIENKTIDQSASYIEKWLTRLKDDRRLVVHAGVQAQKACDFILNVPRSEDGPIEHQPKEYKVVSLRECPTPESMQLCDTPDKAVEYWNAQIKTTPHFNPDCECFAVLMLNNRRRIKGHRLASMGTMDTILVHPREVFREAVATGAAAIVLMHNHPSGEPTPSEGDIKVTRDLIRAGQLMKIEVLDHVIVGHPSRCSLREMGYFYS